MTLDEQIKALEQENKELKRHIADLEAGNTRYNKACLSCQGASWKVSYDHREVLHAENRGRAVIDLGYMVRDLQGLMENAQKGGISECL